MSCNGCRVLRKGCSDSCLLRPCLQWMESPEAQGYATVFVAKFFGRAGLMSFISSVSEPQRPALFQSLLLEACGRTINPVNGAAGLLWTGRWHLCQAAVETVLRGGNLLSIQELACADDDEISNGVLGKGLGEIFCKRNLTVSPGEDRPPPSECDLNLCLTPRSAVVSAMENLWPGTPSMNSDDSITTGGNAGKDRLPRLLNLLFFITSNRRGFLSGKITPPMTSSPPPFSPTNECINYVLFMDLQYNYFYSDITRLLSLEEM